MAAHKAVAEVFPGVPYNCASFISYGKRPRPFMADRHAKKELNKKDRGVRTIERAMEDRTDAETDVDRGYCSAVRSALADEGYHRHGLRV